MMRYFLIGTAVVAIACGIHAQFSITQQPIFSNAATTSQDFATNLAHRWTMIDLTTNVSFNIWTDKVTQVHQLLVAGGGTMSNTVMGVRFTSAGSSMTNRWGINSNLFSILNALGNDTNYGIGMIFKPDIPASDGATRNLAGPAVGNDGNPMYQPSNGNGSGALEMFTGANFFKWAPNPLVTPATNWFAFAWGSTNTATGHGVFVSWINGVYATNFGPDTASGAPQCIGIRNANPAVFTEGFRGWIKEIWVRTNSMAGSGFESFAKDLNYVKTNLYGL